jgi:uncharacterized protein (DUF1697 family)
MMAKVAAFLRGINVGGKIMVPMAALKEVVEGLGYSEVTTILNSGNLVFEARAKKGGSIEKELEGAIAKRFEIKVDVMIRAAAELRQIIEENPFKREAREDPSHLLVTFFKSIPLKERVVSLAPWIEGPERFSWRGAEMYITYPAGIGRSKLTNAALEKLLAVRATARNWNTVQKLAAILEG